MQRILMVGPDRSVHGGISGVVNLYYEAGIDKEIELIYIGTMKDGSKIKKLLVALGAYLRFVILIKKYDIVHVNVASDASFVRKEIFIRTAHLAGKRIVIHQHGGDFSNWYCHRTKSRQKKIIETLRMGDVILTLSTELDEFFKSLVGADRVILFPNSINIGEKDNSKSYKSHEMLFLGRICVTKGIRELFSVLPDVIAKYSDTVLYLGGVWEDEELREEAEKFGENVKFLGWINGNEKREYLAKCPIYIMPTYFEGQPVSVLEAMAAGSCVVTCNVGGIPMMIENGINGIMVEPRNESALKEALMSIIDDEEKKKQLGEAAYTKVAEDFNIEKSIKKLLKIYEELH